MTGTPSNRTTMRTGRTPPFLIIALLIIVGFLSYNYWKFYNENTDLRTQVEAIRVEARAIDTQKLESEKSLNTIKEELKQCKESLAQAQKQVQDKDGEINKCKEDFKKKQEELDGVKNNMKTCDENAATKNKEIETLKAQKAEVDKNLEAEKNKPHPCDMNTCTEPVKQILEIAAKLAGTEKVTKALTEANLDATKLMEKVSLYPPPQR